MRTWSSNSLRSVPAKRSAKGFMSGAYRRAYDAHPRRPEDASEARPELRVMVADDKVWRAVHRGVPGLLRAPLVGRRIRHPASRIVRRRRSRKNSTNTSRNCGDSFHFEFTHQRALTVGRAPTKENLFVFYLPDEREWAERVQRMIQK